MPRKPTMRARSLSYPRLAGCPTVPRSRFLPRSVARDDVTAHPVLEPGHQQQDEDARVTESMNEDVEPRASFADMACRQPVRDQDDDPENRGSDRSAFPL